MEKSHLDDGPRLSSYDSLSQAAVWAGVDSGPALVSPDGPRNPPPPPQASSIENKQDWIKHIREVIQERTVHLKGALKEPIHIPKTAPAPRQKGRRSVSRIPSEVALFSQACGTQACSRPWP